MILYWLFLSFIFIVSLCWGSFLNVVAYRCIHNKYFLKTRSYCPNCKSTLAWYDLIPLISWLLLKGKCRTCNVKISPVYPLIEFSCALAITLYSHALLINYSKLHGFMWLNNFKLLSLPILSHLFIMVIFFSALLINTATDFHTLSVLQLFTLWPIPLFWLASWYGIMPLSYVESILGSIIGYGILWITARLFKYIKGYDGMGEGDFEILALIGTVTGPLGILNTLFIASCAGSVCGIFYLLKTKKTTNTALPFGPFLALGAFCYSISNPITLQHKTKQYDFKNLYYSIR